MKRLAYLDWLRVLSTIAVVVIHVAAGFLTVNIFEVPISHWMAANLFESIARPSVPLFVMISGVLLLSDKRQMNVREFLKKRTSKIFIPLVAWSFIYYVYLIYREESLSFSPIHFIKLFFMQEISNPLWFMYMILGIYLTAPIVKIFIQHASRNDIEYFLLLWFYTSIVVKFMKFYFDFSLNLELFHVTNYVGYFILGYYLATFEINKWWRTAGYIGGITGFVSTFLLTWHSTISAGGVLQEYWYEYHSPNVMLSTIGTFLFFKYTISSTREKLPVGLRTVNQVSFGIYLIHTLVMQVLSNEIFLPLGDYFHPAIAITLNTIGTIIISTILVFIIRATPVLKKIVP